MGKGAEIQWYVEYALEKYNTGRERIEYEMGGGNICKV